MAAPSGKCPKCLRQSTVGAAVVGEIEVKPRVGWYVGLVLLGVISAGILTIMLLVQLRSWPRRLDQEGMTLRDGTFLPWNELTDGIQTRSAGVEQIRLSFGATQVPILAGMGPQPALRNFLLSIFTRHLESRPSSS